MWLGVYKRFQAFRQGKHQNRKNKEPEKNKKS